MATESTSHHHAGEYSSSTSSDPIPPNHLGTNVPSGHFDGSHDPEKVGHDNKAAASADEKAGVVIDEDEDENMDALIDDLESQDGQLEEEEEKTEAGAARPVAEELLQTDTRFGLTESEIVSRRKKFGLNQMKEEKENLILKFLGYFVGPIQFVMEVGLASRGGAAMRLHCVSFGRLQNGRPLTQLIAGCCDSGRRARRLGGFRCDHCPSAAERDCWVCPGVSGRFHCRRAEKDSGSESHCVTRRTATRNRCTGNCSW